MVRSRSRKPKEPKEPVKAPEKAPDPFPSKVFLEWVSVVKNLMFLTNYEVYVSSEPCSADSDAEMSLDEYRRIKISFPPSFISYTPERKRSALVHELAHVPVKIAKRPYESFEATVSSESWSVVNNMGIDAEENAVTILEWTIAPNMPLPPEET